MCIFLIDRMAMLCMYGNTESLRLSASFGFSCLQRNWFACVFASLFLDWLS